MCTGPRLSTASNPPLLLELSASNDVSSLKTLIEIDNQDVNSVGLWYCRRSVGSDPEMGFAARTPLMIAALFANLDALNLLLSLDPKPDANRRSETDGVTALHLASAGGAATSADAVRILIAAGADVNSVDSFGRRPGDVIARQTARHLDSVLNPSSCKNNDHHPSGGGASKEEEQKKKEYPVDVSLPDIKSGLYGTDEFRMYTFKVKPCSRAYSHDWTECPFVHPGENARRRDPRKYEYSCVPCPEFRKGSCRKDDSCEYAHGVFESWLHPAQYRTRLCKDEVGCNRRVCFFAHKLEELRTVNPTAASVNGLVLPSPRSVSNFDLASAGLLSPNAAPSSPGAWMNQAPASLQLPISRLKSTTSARDLDVDYELLGIEGYQQKLIDQIQNSASPRSNYSNLYGSSQLLSGYNTNIQSSMSGLDLSMVKAILSSRAKSFAQRSQSYIDREAVPRSPVTTTTTMQSIGLSDWGSPDGKLNWGIHGEELNKFRKSASFAIRNNRTISPPREAVLEEPDLSWVQSLVKDGAANEPMLRRRGFDQKEMQHQMFDGEKMYSPWGEEQMVN